MRYQKMGHRVPFPQELRIENALDDIDSTSVLYNLKGIVIHMGQGYAYGHYFAVIKHKSGRWLKYDDNSVEVVDEKYIKALFGNPNESR
jgi:ubiquitin C-terminal hydrolase